MISKQLAQEELWRRANLYFLLDKCQKELYNSFYNSTQRIQTWLLARRSGKTYCLCILALEQCLRTPNSIVKFVSPTKLQVRQNVRPLFKQILRTCPEDIKPEFRGSDYVYYFPNGSEIQLAGSDNQHAEKLRGSDSHLWFVDEAGTCDDLENVVKSILLPTTLITRGKGVLASTPPRDSEHDFLKFLEAAEANKTLIKKTLFDNPRITPEDIQDSIREAGGEHTDYFKREFLCEIIKDPKRQVIPEFTEQIEKDCVKDWPRPPFFDCYEAMDLGGMDLTVVLFGYYDYRADKLIIEDELVMDFGVEGNNIEKLTKEIQTVETTLWTNKLTNEVKRPTNRVSDINYIVTQEIAKYSNGQIFFNATKKDDNDSALGNLKILIGARKIIINPKCTTLVRHLKNVKWASANNKTKFARSAENGHYDAVDALKYLVRNVVFSKNPYPAHYDLNLKDLYVVNPEKVKSRASGLQTDIYRKIFNIRKRL